LKSDEIAKRRKILRTPVKPIDVRSIDGIGDLLEAFQSTSIQARNLGRAFQVWKNMLTDKNRPTIFMGLSGPLIAAGLREVLRDCVRLGLVDVVVSTGAILYQDLYQALGFRHYIGSPTADDVELRDLAIDRIYDTYVDEEKFEELDRIIGKAVEKLPPRGYSSREFLEFLGRAIPAKDSLLAICAKEGVPVFSPALIDSSIGIGLTLHYGKNRGKDRFVLDAVRDNYELVQILANSPRTAVVYVGGGTPKNWINDGIVMANYHYNRNGEGHHYALQVTTDVPHWGGLSGSTLDEAMSWGKVSRHATKAQAFVEASIALPLLVGALYDRRSEWQSRKRPKFIWNGDQVVRK
jgi:deoxyhypusine synthase